MAIAAPLDSLAELEALLEEEVAYLSTHQLLAWFPDTGRYRRDLYPKHLEFFDAGAGHMLRLFLAANRVGKSLAGGVEDVYHATGDYPHWWRGRTFDRAVKMWVCGTTDEKVKESMQELLLGPPNAWGTGLIPAERIDKIDSAAGSIKDLVDTVWITHETGGVSQLTFKSYKQGRQAFEATRQDVIHDDEEPPLDVHSEQVLRLADTTGAGRDGCLYITVTPLLGLSDTVAFYLPDGQLPEGQQASNKYVVNATWDDVPHLSEETKVLLRANIPPYQLDARSRGLPMLGAGAIYPVPEEEYLVDPFELPKHWRRAYALDVGWQRTAAVWGAYDPDTDCWYLYHAHYRGEAEASIHAQAIKAPGDWIAGVIDPAARGRSQIDGQRLMQMYVDLGLTLHTAQNAVESGIYEVWERLSTGRLKVFRSLSHWLSEIRKYQRDQKGRIVKKDDHLMDATRYLVMSAGDIAQPVPVPSRPEDEERGDWGMVRGGWMAG